MYNITDEERKSLLISYMELEPHIIVNGLRYDMSACVDAEGVIFYCVNVLTQRLGAKVACLKRSWEQCVSGLHIAYLYNCVLETCEQAIAQFEGTSIQLKELYA